MAKKKIDENIDKYRDNVIYCCKTLDNCGVVYNSKLETRLSPHLTFIISFSSNNLLFDKAPEKELSKRQIALHKLIKFMHDEMGIGYRKIAKKLNSWAIKSETGIKVWHGNNVYGILKRMAERELRLQRQEQIYEAEISKMEIKLLPCILE